MTKILCIYHANCLDGFGAAYAVWKKFPDAEFHAASYGETPPDVTGKEVYIVDFSYKQDVMRDIASQAASVTIYDHHKTAEADLTTLLQEGVLQGAFVGSLSGCVLTWLQVHGSTQPPVWMPYIQDRDLWKFELEGTKEICLALQSYPMAFGVWNAFDSPEAVRLLKSDGFAISRYYNKLVTDVINASTYTAEIGGHKVSYCNAPHFMASDIGNILSEDRPFAATWYLAPDGDIVVSLRSREGGWDVAEIAKQYGGGGHKHAAGFRSKVQL